MSKNTEYTPVVSAFLAADPAREAWHGIDEALIRAHKDFRPFARTYKVKSERKSLSPEGLAAVLLGDARFTPDGGIPSDEVGGVLKAAGYVGRCDDGTPIEEAPEITSWPSHLGTLMRCEVEVAEGFMCGAIVAVTDPVAAKRRAAAAKKAGKKNSGRPPVMYRPASQSAIEVLQRLAAKAGE